MKEILDKFKIPTILGLGIITAGIITAVYLTLREQIFISKAAPGVSAQNITVANISDTEVAVSWQTATPTPSFLTFGQAKPNEQTVLDDSDTKTPQEHLIHYVTLKNLLPKTTYQYRIISGKSFSDIDKFTTATPADQQTGFRPIIGSILNGDKPLNEGVAYLSIDDAVTQSSLVTESGNFLIPISQMRQADLSDIFPLTEDTVAKLTIISERGETIALIKLKDSDKRLPPIKVGESIDLTEIVGVNRFDLNGDGKINTADNSIILGNLGSSFKDKAADLNRDGTVDQQDLDLMAKQINQ